MSIWTDAAAFVATMRELFDLVWRQAVPLTPPPLAGVPGAVVPAPEHARHAARRTPL